jgi:anti-sigma B factor antagonist
MGASDPPGTEEQLQFAIRVVPGAHSGTRVIVEGELDLLTARQLGPAIERELLHGTHVLLDLSGVRFVDSAGLQAIVGALRRARSNGAELKISAALHPQARRLFELTGVVDQLPLVDE